MNDDLDLSKLPPELVKKFMSFLRRTGGEIEVADREGFVHFITENSKEYPVLEGMLKLNEDAVREHYERTGEAPAGVQIIITETQEGDNVTHVKIISPKPEE